MNVILVHYSDINHQQHYFEECSTLVEARSTQAYIEHHTHWLFEGLTGFYRRGL